MDKLLLEQIEDIAVFATVVEQGSFSEAGRRLGIARSAISKRVDRLEKSFGVRLLNRSTRSLSMTEAGQALQERASQSLALLEQARNQVANLVQVPRGVLRITTSVAFGRLCLAPVLIEYMRTYPEVQIQLTLLDRYVDLVEEGYDLAIRLVRKPPELLVAKALMPIDTVVCTSPAYVPGQSVTQPSDLAALNCLYYGYQGFTGEWVFERANEKQTVQVRGNVAVNSSEVIRDLVLNGAGVGVVARYTVAQELQSGKLLELLPQWRCASPSRQTAYALWLPQVHLPPKIRTFVDFMAQRFPV